MNVDTQGLVLVALGGNIAGRLGFPWQAMAHAVEVLGEDARADIARISSLWRSKAVGGGRQPAYHNAVIAMTWHGRPWGLLRLLRRLERRAGRLAGRAWAARTLDLDLLAFGSMVIRPPGMGRRAQGRNAHRWQRRGLVLPHPAMHERAFVLLPLMEVAPGWRHPLLAADVRALAARLSAQTKAQCRRLKRGEAARAWQELARRMHSRARAMD